MDNTELHYIAYDPDEMMKAMMLAYTDAGGDLLYPGDEKEMLLRAMQQIMVQAFAGVDNALRMDTLRYAVRDYLDVYGEKRGCYRIGAQAAAATVEITMIPTGTISTIPAGTAMTVDGTVLYQTMEEHEIDGGDQVITATIMCAEEGSVGNGLVAGTQLQTLVPIDGLANIVCTVGAAGGQDKEEDEHYRNRIRTYGLTSITTGARQQYEAAAKGVSSQIIDARALNLGGGQVGVYILAEEDADMAAILQAVEQTLSGETTRPLTDQVSVAAATAIEYTLVAECSHDGSSRTQAAIAEAVEEYKAWQEETIGRAFNPDMLSSLLYRAGATRVQWGEGSEFDGGTVEYTTISPNKYCSGTISVEMITV